MRKGIAHLHTFQYLQHFSKRLIDKLNKGYNPLNKLVRRIKRVMSGWVQAFAVMLSPMGVVVFVYAIEKTSGVLLYCGIILGFAFAFGWTPCIGPILASILVVAASSGQVGQGVGLLAVYSLGLGLPFLLSGLLFHQFLSAFKRFRKHIRLIEIGTGVMLMVVGVMLMFSLLGPVTMFLYQWVPVRG